MCGSLWKTLLKKKRKEPPSKNSMHKFACTCVLHIHTYRHPLRERRKLGDSYNIETTHLYRLIGPHSKACTLVNVHFKLERCEHEWSASASPKLHYRNYLNLVASKQIQSKTSTRLSRNSTSSKSNNQWHEKLQQMIHLWTSICAKTNVLVSPSINISFT